MVVKSENTGQALRRSTRVPIEIAVRVRSLDPGFQFEENCHTLLVNAQGCGFQCSRQLPVGIAVLFTIDGRQATATVLNATALGNPSGAWVIGAKLHQSGGNFWGLASPPSDWADAPTQRADASHVTIDKYIADRVAAEIQGQSETAMAGLRAELEKAVSTCEAGFRARLAQYLAVSGGETVRQVAEEGLRQVRETVETLSRQFQQDIAEKSEQRAAEIEGRLHEAQLRLLGDAQAKFAALGHEIEQNLQQNAKRLSDSATAQWHAALEQTLQRLPELVRESMQHVAGDEPTITRH